MTDLDFDVRGKVRKAMLVRMPPEEHAALVRAARAAGTSLQALARARLILPAVESTAIAVQLDEAASVAAHDARSAAATRLAAANVGRPSKRKGRKFPKPAL